ncbi:MAG: M28 family peptidase, partial [Euryarchaeota archaeon TMED192]
MSRDWRVALSMVLVMASASASGCFGGDDNDIDSSDLSVDVDVLASGFFQTIELQSSVKMSVYVPYLLLDPETGFVQNSTVIDIEKGSTATLDVLVPPRSDGIYLLLGEYGRVHWPIRSESESWSTWATRGGDEGLDDAGAIRVPANDTTFDTLEIQPAVMAGSVEVKFIPSIREPSVAIEEGGGHSSGMLHGRIVYERLYEISDPTDTLDPVDGKAGYFDRWAGQGNPAYEDAALYIIGNLESFGLEVIAHRYEYTDIMNVQNPEAYNICAYKWGSVYPDEWMVFGAHFDVAPPANAVLLDPHVVGFRTYGTRAGAYDNSAGTAMVMETARALADFDTRRTMVFCLWSGEEGGKRGSDY